LINGREQPAMAAAALIGIPGSLGRQAIMLRHGFKTPRRLDCPDGPKLFPERQS